MEANKQSYAPAFRISYEALDPIASQRDIRTFEGLGEVSERIAALEAKIAVLEAALNVATLSFPTGMSDYEVPSVTQHGTLVTAGTLPAASAGYVIHVLGVNRETLNATCEADWVRMFKRKHPFFGTKTQTRAASFLTSPKTTMPRRARRQSRLLRPS